MYPKTKTADYTKKRRELIAEKIDAKQRLEDHDKAGKAWRNYAENLIITSHTAYEVFQKGSVQNKMALLKTICQDLRLENKVIHFKYKEPFNWVVELNQSKKSSNLSQVRRG